MQSFGEYCSRYENILETSQVRTTKYGKNSFHFEASRVWNGLPNDIRSAKDYKEFARLIRTWTGPKYDDYEWQPPTEAELKIIQARRERSDKISKLMGDYLLKGYKMLAFTCPDCCTILLEDKQGKNYCVACKELDTDTDKDDPVLNTTAARSQILEGSVQDFSDADELSYMIPLPQPTSQVVTVATRQSNIQSSSLTAITNNPQATSPSTMTSSGVSCLSAAAGRVSLNMNFEDTVETLCQKIKWATDELKISNNMDNCIRLCQLITASANAIQSLKSAS